MKRTGNLYAAAFTRESLYAGYLEAAKGKRSKRACFNFERRLGSNIEALYQELQSGSYQPRPYYTFEVFEPKRRLIYAPAFRDCVVQHAVYRTITPIFGRSFIDQSFACRKGMGTHKAADYAQASLQQCDPDSYVLQLDIRKFFYRIDRPILRMLIERKIKDAPFVDVMMQFADHGEPIGIPIGNLLSQTYALIYLNPLDHFIKRELKAKKYCRYVDDFVLFGLARDEALRCKARIVEFIATELKLELSKWTLARVRKGLNFVGYRTWASKRFIRKRSLYNCRMAIKQSSLVSLVSILGHAKRTHSLQHLLTTTKERSHALYLQIPKSYRRYHHPYAAHAC